MTRRTITGHGRSKLPTRRTITVHGQRIEQVSLDGGHTWSTSLDDLRAYEKRVQDGMRGAGEFNAHTQRGNAASVKSRRMNQAARRRAKRAERSEHHNYDLDGMSNAEAARAIGVNEKRASALLKSGVRRIWRQQVAEMEARRL